MSDPTLSEQETLRFRKQFDDQERSIEFVSDPISIFPSDNEQKFNQKQQVSSPKQVWTSLQIFNLFKKTVKELQQILENHGHEKVG